MSRDDGFLNDSTGTGLAARVHGLMPESYFPLIVVFAGRYDKRSGIGTVIALMLPAFIALTIVWTLFFVVWYLLGIPFGL
ncbi:MAG: AbgT family transporter, partial [Trebonia sp.]